MTTLIWSRPVQHINAAADFVARRDALVITDCGQFGNSCVGMHFCFIAMTADEHGRRAP